MVILSSARHLQSIGERIFQNRQIFFQIEGLEVGYRILIFFGPEKNPLFWNKNILYINGAEKKKRHKRHPAYSRTQVYDYALVWHYIHDKGSYGHVVRCNLRNSLQKIIKSMGFLFGGLCELWKSGYRLFKSQCHLFQINVRKILSKYQVPLKSYLRTAFLSVF